MVRFDWASEGPVAGFMFQHLGEVPRARAASMVEGG